MEEWRAVVGYEGLYEVSSLGRVRSLPRLVNSHFGMATRGGNVLSPVLVKTGYRQVTLRAAGRKRSDVLVQILVLNAFRGPAPQGYECCHNNGIRDDNRLENLRWDTRKNNLADRHKHGTAPIGENGNISKLTNEQVIEIKRALQQPYRGILRALGRRYGVCAGCISSIRHGKSWTHITLDVER